jgi:hypothetical protein
MSTESLSPSDANKPTLVTGVDARSGAASALLTGTEDIETLPIDERIRRAELRLIAREDALRTRYGLLRERLASAARPARLLAWPGLGVAGGVLALLIVWRRLGRQARQDRQIRRARERQADHGAAREAAAGRRHRHPGARPRGRGELPWVRMVAFVWPMLPARWRSHVSPGAAAALATFGVPLFERLMARRQAAAERRAARLESSGMD